MVQDGIVISDFVQGELVTDPRPEQMGLKIEKYLKSQGFHATASQDGSIVIDGSVGYYHWLEIAKIIKEFQGG
jgi:hypothetical protein